MSTPGPSAPPRGTVAVHGDWLLTPERAAVHVPTSTAVIADLHLGYDQARRRRGEAVPLTGPDDIVAALSALVTSYGIRRLVVAGDLFEERKSGSLGAEFLAWTAGEGIDLAAVVPGNHDRELQSDVGGLPVYPEGFRLGRWRVLHGDGELPPGNVVLGHFHPSLRWAEGVKAPCFLTRPGRIVLPAFSADAAGVNVLTGPRWHSYHCFVVVGREVLDFGEVGRLANRRRLTRRSGSATPRRRPPTTR